MTEYTAHEVTMNRWRNPKRMIRVHCPSDGPHAPYIHPGVR